MNKLETPQLPASCSIAFKEWAVVCEALAEGRQTLILRKGGIHEGREGFRVQHGTFWLYPTNFHQQPEHLAGNAGDLLPKAKQQQPPSGEFYLRQLAVVDEVLQLNSEAQAKALIGSHIWSESTVRERFHYRQPGLFLLVVRIFRQNAPQVVIEQPEMAGCKSWVELSEPLTTGALKPVLTDAEFLERKSDIEARLASTQ